MTWAIDERDMSLENQWRAALFTVDIVRLLRVERLVAVGSLTAWALVELSVGVTELDGDVTQFLTEKTNGLKRD